MTTAPSGTANPGRIGRGFFVSGDGSVKADVAGCAVRGLPGYAPVLIRFWRDARAATAIEYCLVAGLISLAVVAGATSIGSKLASNYYGKIGASLS